MSAHNPRTRYFVPAITAGLKPGDTVPASVVETARLKPWNAFDYADRPRGSVIVTTSSDTATALAARRGGIVYEVSVDGIMKRDSSEMAAGTAYIVDGVVTVARVIPVTETARAKAMGRADKKGYYR